MKKSKRVLELMGAVMETGVVVIVILLAGFVFLAPRFGWGVNPVMSGSMEPALKVGGVVVSKPIPFGEVREGDIISFRFAGQREVITHRVIRIIKDESGKTWLQTKGDANEDPDPNLVGPTPTGKIQKVVFHLPYLGYLAVFMKSKFVFPILVGIPALILIIMFSRDIWQGILEEKEKRKGKSINPKQGKKG